MTQPLILNLDVDNAQAISSINAFFDVYEKGVQGMGKALGDALGKETEVAVHLKVEGDKIIAEGVEKVGKEVKQVEQAAKLMNNEFGKTPNELRMQLKLLKDLQGNTRKYADDGKTVTAEWKKVEQMINGVNEALKKMGSGGGSGGGGISGFRDNLIASQIAADTLMGSFNMLANGVRSFVSTGMEMEVLFIQLQGFTGGVQQATDAYKRFVEIGQATPFTAKEVGAAARTMMGFGIETNKAIDQVERLAIVAAATGGELTHMARNMGQIQANQKAYTRDLMQFANQGIPIYQQMADILDVSTEEIRTMAEEGQIGFTEVSAALREMTKEGSAFQTIADKMDRTFSARMEAMVSAVESFAGQFLGMISEFDNAIGGPLSTTLGFIIDRINDVADGFGYISANIRELAPVIGAVTGAFVALFAIAAAQNFVEVYRAIKMILTVTKLWTVATWALSTAQAVSQALLGNFAVVALAAGAAAGITALAVSANADALDEQNTALNEANELAKADIESREKQAFATDGLTGSVKKHVEERKKEFDAIRENQDLSKKRAQLAIQWQEAELKAFKESQKERREALKDSAKIEKDLHKENMDRIKSDHKEKISLIDQELSKRLEVIDAELGRLDEQSAAEKEIERRKRRRLEIELKTLKVGSDEWLQTKVELEQMDKKIKRAELLKQRDEERLEAAKDKKAVDEDRDGAIKAEDSRHESVMENIESETKALDDAYIAEKSNLELMKNEYNNYFTALAQERFSDHEEAMEYMRQQITAWGEYERAAITALDNIEKYRKSSGTGQGGTGGRDGTAGHTDLSTHAAGGPMRAGERSYVNELGKEAFLSASGKLSMINAPAWGIWKAPSDGTVIPAHLTKQLDIPAGGININKTPSMRGGAYGSVSSATVAAGDNILNNVTVQSVNPGKTASDMLVSMTKIRRRRLR